MTNYYSLLAPIYERIGLADFAAEMTPQIIQYAQQHDWTGRSIADLGCGTGAASRWLTNHGYVTTAIDHSEEMLATARRLQPTGGLSLSYEKRDLRELANYHGSFDLVLAFDVINECSSLRELEPVFQGISTILEPGKLFVFDVYTIQGLTKHGAHPERLIFEDPSLMVMTRTDYDYDRQICAINYLAFHRDGELWRRFDCERVLRGYPIQALATLLQRTGFTVNTMMTPDFGPYELGRTQSDRVLFLANKN
ncbi:MAG: class I SAM-dependent methyltransferase [Anaerolineae bacterium]|nr:class I SAM-dependent methyltransferase [Anaerolineae bacterium]MCA9910155.1 class I SAM-dependent methyltransferase [Anaerolineae bacterium]